MIVPPGIAALPRFGLLDGASPIAPLRRFSAALGGGAEVWIKREDLLPLAFGGNKLRNLEFLVGAALAEGADTLITSGRRWSNHCRLTAAAGARAGLAVHLVLTGPPSALGDEGPNQRLDELLGATIHVTATEDRAERAALVETVAAQERAAGRRPFVIGVGGTGPVGAAGQVLAGLEAADQLAGAGIGHATVVLPSATGGTQAGVLTGLALASPPARSVIGCAVAAPSDELRPTIDSILDGLEPLVGIRVPPDSVVIDDDQLGAGYGRPTAAADDATRLLARTEGILVDPIYTAKALAGLIARVRDGRLGGPIMFWHAGGGPGLFETLATPG
ncbi:MAG TPA: pyridoxal-phosphate dependent enzyme [Candidatus Limnocylindrales bacterium]|nr:pyridoxal-phosphate dependent enzyme [Candidatus Limnocylindrales bacterium]